MLIITLTNVPPSLQGELSKYCQQLQTNVYVSNVGARIRESLWGKVTENIGNGEATMCWSTNNELGYDYLTTRKNYEIGDYDGIPLMIHLAQGDEFKHGFSSAYKYHQAHIHSYSKSSGKSNKSANKSDKKSIPVVCLDIETTGLDNQTNKIISIGACRQVNNKLDTFYCIVKINENIPDKIQKLTGIQNTDDGIPIEQAINRLLLFIGNDKIVGYNIKFDLGFINKALKDLNKSTLVNKYIDVEKLVKKDNPMLMNYHLVTVCRAYNIDCQQFHNSLEDSKATLKLYEHLTKS
jgi:CRISPR-associated protein Cas2